MFLQGLDTIRSQKCRGVASYQDLEANTDLLYNKSSDIFSLGCVIFEIWQGTYLLRYSSYCFKKNQENEREEYAKVVSEGRILNIKDLTWPFVDAPRIPLATIVQRSMIKPCPLVLDMIQPRMDRITIEQVLTSGIMTHLRQELDMKKWNLDEGILS